MMPPLLHFGYFDLDARQDEKFWNREEPNEHRLMEAFHEIFGGFPGRAMPGIGFYHHYGLLTCACPSVFGTAQLPVARILELVYQSGCDVIWCYNTECHLVSRDELAQLLDPKRPPPESVGLS